MIGLSCLLISTVGYASLVLPAKTICLGLSTEIGRPVIVSKDLGERFVFMAPHGRSPHVVLQALGSCLHASVVDDGQRVLISRTKSDLKEIESHVISTRIEWLKKKVDAVEEHRRQVSFQGVGAVNALVREFESRERASSNGTAISEAPPIREFLPSESLLLGIVKRIGIRDLAESSLNETTVFEDRPVLDNKPLPEHADLDQAYQNAMDAFSQGGPLKIGLSGNRDWATNVNRFAPGLGIRPAPIERLRLAEVCLGNEVTLLLSGYDSAGYLVANAELTAGPTNALKSPAEIIERSKVQGKKQRFIELSDAGVSAAGFGQMPEAQPFPSWFLNPDKVEPLSLFVQPVMQTLAQEDPESSVAIEVTDSFWNLVRQCIREGKVSIETLQESMTQWTPFEKVKSPGALVYRPIDPYSVEHCQADRKELSRFARQVWTERKVGLRVTGRLYKFGSLRPGFLTNTWEFNARVALDQWSTPGKNLRAHVYRLIGAIDDHDWDLLVSGRTLSADRLGATAELKDVLYQEYGVIPEGQGPFPDIYQHPCEAYTESQISQSPISIRALNTQIIQDWPQANEKATMWAPLFGDDGKPVLFKRIQMKFRGAHPEPASTRDQYEASLSKRLFRIGHADDTTLTIAMPRRLFIRAQSRGYGTSDSDPMPYVDLPKNLRDTLWGAAFDDVMSVIQKFESNAKANGQASGSPAIPPPPPAD